jgi:hypothetical protein
LCSQVPYFDHSSSNGFPTVNLVVLLGVEVVLFLSQVILLKELKFLYFLSKLNGEFVVVEFVDIGFVGGGVGG